MNVFESIMRGLKEAVGGLENDKDRKNADL